MKMKMVFLVIILFALLMLIISCSMTGNTRNSSYPRTFNDAYKEYQNGNKAPLEGFLKWLEDNP